MSRNVLHHHYMNFEKKSPGRHAFLMSFEALTSWFDCFWANSEAGLWKKIGYKMYGRNREWIGAVQMTIEGGCHWNWPWGSSEKTRTSTEPFKTAHLVASRPDWSNWWHSSCSNPINKIIWSIFLKRDVPEFEPCLLKWTWFIYISNCNIALYFFVIYRLNPMCLWYILTIVLVDIL